MNFLSYVQAIVLFLVVLALAVMTTRAAAYRMRSQTRHMRVLESVSLAPGKQVVMVKVPGRVMVLGVSEKSVRRLMLLDESIAKLDDGTPEVKNLMDENSFARMLRKVTFRDR